MTQYWPADDTFANPIAPEAQDWFPYMRCDAWTTDPAYGSGGSGIPSPGTGSINDYLFDGWFGQTTGIPNASATPAAYVFVTAGAGGPPNFLGFHFRAHLWRELSTLDSGTEISWQMQADNIGLANTTGTRLCVGVCARVQGGSMSATLNRLQLSSGYYFLVGTQSVAPFGTKYVLLSVNSGVITRLADTPAGASTFGSFQTADFVTPHRMRMTIETEAGNVRIKCYNSTEANALAATETLVFNVLDSSGTKITTAGRNGFVISCERRPGGSFTVAPCLNWWQFSTVDRLTVYLRDEWTRNNLQASAVVDAQHALLPGNALTSGWYGDYFSTPGAWPGATSTNAPAAFFHDGPVSGIPRLVIDPVPSSIAIDVDGFFISQRPADNSATQARSIVGRYSSTGSSLQERAFGVALRCSLPAPSARPNCYYCAHEIDDVALSAVIRLYRSSSDGVKVIAEKIVGVTYALDTDTKIGLTTATVTGATKLRVRLNDVLVVLVAPAVPVSGIAIAGDGTVTDSSAEAVLAGVGEAIYARKRWHNAGSMRRLYLDTWTQGPTESYNPIDPPPPPPPPVDLTPIPVSGETDGAFGTLVLGAGGQWSVDLEPVDPGVVHEYESDHDQAFAVLGANRRSWTIGNRAVGSSADAALLSFYDAHLGCELPFQWATPQGDTIYAAFTTERLDQAIRDAGVYGYKFGLQERFP